jgi:ATP-dependent RNA helicase DeaD
MRFLYPPHESDRGLPIKIIGVSVSFENFELKSNILKGVQSLGFENPTEIQAEAIPLLMNHQGDFVGQAQTGTGKTIAFLLPLLQEIDLNAKSVQAIIIAPTRELAAQVYTELENVSKFTDLKAMTVYGGVPYERQISQLKKKGTQVVVGTPGRVIDLIDRGVLKLEDCKNLILDEADEMLNMGFLEDVQRIITELTEKRKIWMFSESMPKAISELVKKEFKDPEFLKIKKENLTNDNIDQFYCTMNRKDFQKGLRVIIESNKDALGIIFCETRNETATVADTLVDFGISALALHGDLSQAQRDFAMKRFKDKKVRFLVCTDIAARGIDVSHVTHVFNMGFPRQTESYVHRIGRTGRAGEHGTAITFVTPKDRFEIKKVERTTNQVLKEFLLPSLQEIKKIKVAGDLERMEKLKEAVTSLEDQFNLDDSFGIFANFFADLSKEEILKVLFSSRFNREFRQIEEGLIITPPSSRSERSRSSSSRRGGSSSRRGSRSGEKKEGRSGERGGERRGERSSSRRSYGRSKSSSDSSRGERSGAPRRSKSSRGRRSANA